MEAKMNRLNYFLYPLFLSFAVETPALQTGVDDYWQCITIDSTNKQWIAQNYYKKVAQNNSSAQCKQQSLTPASCRTPLSQCERYIHGFNISPMWVCTALDFQAIAWRSNEYTLRDDAALAAKDYCREKSSVPATCYVNMVTCVNKNQFNL